jgi:hypothetical protein
MLNKVFSIAATLVVFAAMATAQTNFTVNKTETAIVPFSFNAGDRTFPAGVYTVQLDHERQTLTIRSENQKPLVVLANNQETNQAPKKSQLVFRRIGEHFFLKEAWVQGSNEGQSLLPGSFETELARHQAEPTQTIAVQAQAR